MRLYGDEDFTAHPELPKGYIGVHYAGASVVVADPSVRAGAAWVTGANRTDHHARNAVLGRDFDVEVWADIVAVVPGDPCPRCGQPLSIDRGIEVGHVFQLGTKYSRGAGRALHRREGRTASRWSWARTASACRACSRPLPRSTTTSNGLAWPAALAPYAVHLIVVPGRGDGAAAVIAEAERVYEELRAQGIDVLYDDRDVSPGVKFADADLVGVPVQLVVGAKGVGRGVIERKVRATGERDELPLQDVGDPRPE